MSGRSKNEPAAGKPGSKKKVAASPAARKPKTNPAKAGRSNAQEKRRRKAAKPTNDALYKAIEELRTLFAEADRKDVENRYVIAVKCRDLRDAGKYGDGAVATAAAKLNRKPATIKNYANVAKIWPDPEKFSKLAAKKGKRGKTLSWYHFVDLTREENGNRRRSLMTKALKEGWSVAELEAARRSKDRKKRKKSTDTGKSQSQSSGTSAARIEKASTQLAQLAGSAEGFHKEIEKVDQDELADVREVLQKGRQAASKLVETYDQRIEQIDLLLELTKHRLIN